MRLMISYARRVDTKFVYELADELHDTPNYTVWIDRKQIVGGADWWAEICDAVENAECILVVLTKRYLESIYCMAELEYAIALNKPLLPLNLELDSKDYPVLLSRVQIEDIREASLDKTMRLCLGSFTTIVRDTYQGKYAPPAKPPTRPDVPKQPLPPAPKASDLFQSAVEAMDAGNLDTAEKLLKQIENDARLGKRAATLLAEIQTERERASEYERVANMLRTATSAMAKRAAEGFKEDYIEQFGTDYDPLRILGKNATASAPTPVAPPQTAVPNTAPALTAEQWFDKGFAATDYDEKIRCYTEAIRLKPDYADAYNNRGVAYMDGKHDYDRAIANYNEAIHLKPDYVEAYNNRGKAHHYKGDYDRAIADYSRSIELRNPELHVPYNHRGLAYKNKGEYDRAIADYTEAIRLKPDYAAAYNNRGNAYIDGKSDHDRAIADYTEAIRLKPDYAAAYNNRGQAYQNGKYDVDSAIADYNQAIYFKPDFAEAYNNRGWAWYNKNDFDRALADFNEAIRLDPKLAEAYHYRGNVYYMQKQYDRAITEYETALQIDPNHQLAKRNIDIANAMKTQGK